MSRKSASTNTTPASYGDAVAQLEQLVASVESGQLPLEQLLIQYQRGSELLRYCQDRLRVVEHQVKVLDADDDSASWRDE